MSKALLLCVCRGTCPAFQKMNVFEVLNTLRKEQLVDFVALHPQLCADDGDEFLKSFLKNKDIKDLYIAGCDPTMQKKMFRNVFEKSGFDVKKHHAVDIRNMNTKQAVEAIKKLIKN